MTEPPPLDGLDIIIRTWGPLALFTRPDLRVQRVSYPIPTPSALSGLVSCVYWKPEAEYRVQRLGIVKGGGTMQVMRNELGDRQGERPPEEAPMRQQRNSVFLTDVEYLVHLRVYARFGRGPAEAMKHANILRDRLTRGQRFRTPYLGTRECAAQIELATPDAQPDVSFNLDVGPLLFAQAFVPDPDGPVAAQVHRHQRGQTQGVVRRVTPMPLYIQDAQVRAGWLHVPQELYRRLNLLEDRA
ncbi:CRISPR-associated protein Cas5 [Deinococcus sp. ME38]|uniref:CRISPR-associated protein Cas5 n=1 Tax=Deinococcus sp. ME38 TaxID=3400344 RepID=UPI003B5BD650